MQHFPIGGLFGKRIDTLRVGRWPGPVGRLCEVVGKVVGKVIIVMDLI